MYGSYCFEKSMRNIPQEWTCDCPVECNSLSYSFRVASTPLDSEALCPLFDLDQLVDMKDEAIMKPFYTNQFPSHFVRKLIKLKHNISSKAIDYCKKNLQYRAVVTFKMATDTMSVTVISRRLSFFDKMSAFGSNSYSIFFYCIF